MKKWLTKGKRALALVMSVLMAAGVLTVSIPILKAQAAAGEVPDHEKNLIVNDDGTYTIALNVTGDSEKQIQKVNVIVIVDRSGSMSTQSGTGAYVPTNGTGTGLYGLIDGEYVPLTRQGGAGNRTFWYNGVQYTGQRYQYDGTATRLQATQEAVSTLADNLLNYNGKDDNPDDTVEMALVTFATSAQTSISSTTSASTYTSAVADITVATGNAAGTNWEAALKQADTINFGDSDPTYVIFFSDGAPTFYGSTSGSGQEQEPNMSNSYNAATDDAAALAQKVGVNNFYTIFAYGTDAGKTYMANLTEAAGAPAANNYSASNSAELKDAFDAILESIEMAGIGNVGITDGTTSSVTTTTGEVSNLLTVDTSSYKYYRAGGTDDNGDEKYDSTANGGLGEEWADAPAATFEDGAVKWSIDGVLENDVTYTVTFDCWPSQTTLDIVADIKNDPSSYDDLDENIKKYIDEDGNLKTNTSATLSYTDTRTGQSGSSEFTNPDPVTTQAVEQLAVSKEWENTLDGQSAEPITLTVTRDGTAKYTTTLSNDNDWTDSVYISIGILRHADDGDLTDSTGAKYEVLEKGHDFTFTEPADLGYYWELEVPTVRPMLLDNTLTMLILKGDAPYNNSDNATEYTIDGKTYYVGDTGNASLTATNHRRARLNLTKVVDGEDADPDQTFPFTLNVVDSKASEGSADNLNSDYYVWFSIYNGGYIDAVVSGAEKEMKDGAWTGFYYAPSGTDIVVNLKAGDNLRFLNLPSGSTYTFTEGTLPANYAFTSSVLTAGTDSTFKGAQTTTGTIEKTNIDYTVTYTNTYDLSDIEITKVWEDNDDQDGIRPTADEFKQYLVLKADGTDVTAANASKLTVVDKGDGTYTVKWTGLNRYNNGEEITYTVEETEIEGYTTTGSPAEDKGTITNSHTPEVTSVTVTKVWDDDDDIGEIRPASINVQLTADGTASGEPVALNAGNEWTYTWENLPKYNNGTEIAYTADETAVPAGYDKTGPEKTTAEDGTVTFTVTNTYNPTPVIVDPPVQKVITGNDDLYNGGDFTFTIENTAAPEGVTPVPMPENTEITNSADYELEDKEGFYEFGEIEFTMPGTYEYKITESGSVDGVTNDSAAEEGKTITFTVTDDGTGNLVVSPTTDQVQLSFTNVYDAEGEASIVVTKEITGAAWPANKTLTLTIAGADNAPMPEETTATLSAARSVTFGPIAYGLADAGKEYTYTITEDSFGAGWSGAPASITATVAVSDNGDGTLATEVTYSPEDATFTNTYKATGKATLEAIKAIEGAAWPEGKTLTLTLAGTESAPMPAAGGETAALTAPGTATFGEIAYTEADAGKTYTYTISEDGFGTGWIGSGDITATVEVTDKGDGTLETTVTYSPEDATITNTYEAKGEAVLEATKAIEGAAWPTGKTITFTLSGEGGTLPETKTVTLTEAGKATFGAIAYTEADAGKTYTYTISEDGFGTGWTGSGSVTATVKVTDNGDGTLKTEVTYDPTDATITNTYKASGTAEISVDKVLTGRDWLEGEEYTFTLKDDAAGETIEEKTVSEDNLTANFTAITYSEADAGKTFTYTVSETSTLPGGISKSGDVTVTVTVTDKGDGTLSTEVTYTDNNSTITNTYEASGEIELEAAKELVGREWQTGETYTFTLKDAEGNVIDEQVVDSNTTVTFDAIEYTEADMVDEDGNYSDEVMITYTIEETTKLPGGVTNSGVIEVTVTLVDDGEGNITATAAYSNDDKIVNTYNADGTADLKASKKLVGRDWLDDESYTFTLTAKTEGAPMPKTDTTVEFTADGEKTFGTITYDESDAGNTYEYTISETSKLPSGISKSSDITATVKVTDKGDGTLETEVTYSPEDATITNTYKAEGKAAIEVKKAVTGAAWPADKTLTLTLNGEGGTLPETKTVELTAAGTAKFDDITYTEADAGKTYTYTISEDGFGAGWTGSGDVTATVKVTDNGNGTLATEVTYSPEDATITNTYKATGDVTLTADKNLTGREWKDSETVTFTLLGSDGKEIEAKKIGENGTVTFTKIDYDESDAGKKYEYTISETSDLPSGVTKSADIKATVTVTDNGDGTLKTEVTYTNNDTIVNTYTAEPVKATVNVSKVIDGYIAGEDANGKVVDRTFTFTMTGPKIDGALTTTVTTKNGTGIAAFDEITYTFDDMVDDEGNRVTEKKFTYTVKETEGSDAGFDYDKKEYNVVVTVKDDQDGKLVVTDITKATDESNVEIVNTFAETEYNVTLTLNKEIEDLSNSAKDATFTFQLLDGDGNVVEEKTITTKEFKGSVDFSEITFEAAGTYSYILKEIVPTATTDSDDASADDADTTDDTTDDADTAETVEPGQDTVTDGAWTYDVTEYPVVITITDNFETAELEGTVKINGETTTSLKITNIYKAQKTETELYVMKEVDDTSGSAYETTFDFTLKDAEGTVIGTASVTGPGKATFDAITYEKAGEYNYTIQEKATNAAGYIYDETEYPVKVTVVDEDGKLVASVAYGKDSATELTVTNTYDPKDAEAAPQARKVVDDKSDSAPDGTFTFQLLDADGNVVETVSGKAGYINFSKLTFAKVGTYKYTIKEVAGSTAGFTYDTVGRDLEIVVTDAGKGALEAKINYLTDEGEAVITNPYEAEPTSAQFKVEKELNGMNEGVEPATFTFTLSGDVEKEEKVTIKGSGTATFSEIKYTKVGTYYYTVVEVNDGAKGYTYDGKVYTITVEVKDEGGKLVATPTITGGDSIKFVNTYKTSPVQITIDGTKQLKGRDLKDGEFTFAATIDGKTVATGVNDAAGKITIGPIEFTKPGDYTVVVTETAGTLGGVTYDKAEFTVTVKVVDNGDGTLTATSTGEDAIIFINTYEAKSVEVQLKATKQLIGRDLKAGEFSFTVSQGDSVFANGKNDKDGNIIFDAIKLEKAGTYKFILKEVAGKDLNTTYDKAEHEVTVVVKDDGNGNLVVEGAKDGVILTDVSFKNTYAPPVPKTGDTNHLVLWLLLLIVAFGAVASGVVIYRKTRKER